MFCLKSFQVFFFIFARSETLIFYFVYFWLKEVKIDFNVTKVLKWLFLLVCQQRRLWSLYSSCTIINTIVVWDFGKFWQLFLLYLSPSFGTFWVQLIIIWMGLILEFIGLSSNYHHYQAFSQRGKATKSKT